MTTYGPDINVGLPRELNDQLDGADLHRKVNYYAPAMAALSLASPLYRGGLWQIRGAVGKSIRPHRRSVIAPAIELHPEENGRMEFKLFEATNQLADYHAYMLLWLTLLLDDQLLTYAPVTLLVCSEKPAENGAFAFPGVRLHT